MKYYLVIACFFMQFAGVVTGQTVYEVINPANITLVRDSFGVPHIYGKTDAEASYGLAWAHAEDDFYTIQLNLLAAQGQAKRDKGRKRAAYGHSRATYFCRPNHKRPI